MTRLEAEKLLQSTKLRIAMAGHQGLVMPPLQSDLYGWIRDTLEWDAAGLAAFLNKSVQTISSTLRRMQLEGWLDRRQEAQESGGYEWIYTVHEEEVTGS